MSTLVNQVGNILEGVTGSGTFVGATMPTLSSPTVNQLAFNTSPGVILDENGNNMLSMISVGSAVNYFAIDNAAAGTSVGMSAQGSDSNIYIGIQGKGTSGVAIYGTKAGDQGGAGVVGQVITSNIPFGSALSFTTGVIKDITSISLTAGDWDVYGNVTGHTASTLTSVTAWINTTSVTQPDYSNITITALSTNYGGLTVPSLRVNVTTTTTVYLTALFTGSGGITGCGTIYARRVR